MTLPPMRLYVRVSVHVHVMSLQACLAFKDVDGCVHVYHSTSSDTKDWVLVRLLPVSSARQVHSILEVVHDSSYMSCLD